MKLSPPALGRYLLDPRQGDPPLDPEELFSREAPLQVEVGFGGGEYLAWWSGREPEADFIGIELPPDCLWRAAGRLEEEGRSNVRLVQGDARYLLHALFRPQSLRRVLMQFPMPWPKERHAKHRVSSPAFAATLASVLEVGGRFELVTDQDWYAAECREHFAAHPAFAVIADETDPDRPFRTRYESKWLEEGRTIYRLELELLEARPAESPLAIRPMEHLRLPSVPADETVRALPGRTWKEDGLVAEVKAVFRGEEGWLLRAVAADEAFSQMFHLRLRPREDGACLVQVDGLPRPYYTAAVRLAQRGVATVLGGA